MQLKTNTRADLGLNSFPDSGNPLPKTSFIPQCFYEKVTHCVITGKMCLIGFGKFLEYSGLQRNPFLEWKNFEGKLFNKFYVEAILGHFRTMKMIYGRPTAFLLLTFINIQSAIISNRWWKQKHNYESHPLKTPSGPNRLWSLPHL